MAEETLSSLINAGTQVYAAVTGSSKKQTKRAKELGWFNYDLNELAAQNAYDRGLEAWNMQNEYNLPSNEVQRLKDAGLSVGAYYSGTPSGASANFDAGPQGAGSSGSARAAPVSASDQINSVANIMSLRAQDSQIRLNNSAADRNEAEAGIVPVRAEYLQSQTLLNQFLGDNTKAKTAGTLLANNLQAATLPYDIKQAEQAVEVNIALLESYEVALEREWLQYDVERSTFDTRIDTIEADLRLKYAGIATQYAQAEALRKGIPLTEAQVDQIYTAIETELLYERPEILAHTESYGKRDTAAIVQSLASAGATVAGIALLRGRIRLGNRSHRGSIGRSSRNPNSNRSRR